MDITNEIRNIILEAKNNKAQDLHFHPREDDVAVYHRINQKLILDKYIDLETYNKLLRHVKFQSKLEISSSNMPQEGSFTITSEEENTIFNRVSIIPLIDSESLVIRILPELEYAQFETLTDDVKGLSEVYDIINQEHGLFIFTGKSGSGKTTLIDSILKKMSLEDNKNIVSIENPIEINNDAITQIQINEDMRITYRLCIKAALRQNPDLIMVAEIRDEETAKEVFEALSNGYSVISTIQGDSVNEILKSLSNFGISKNDMEKYLIGISNQELTTKIKFDFTIGNDLTEVVSKYNILEMNSIDINVELQKFIDDLDTISINSKTILKNANYREFIDNYLFESQQSFEFNNSLTKDEALIFIMLDFLEKEKLNNDTFTDIFEAMKLAANLKSDSNNIIKEKFNAVIKVQNNLELEKEEFIVKL